MLSHRYPDSRRLTTGGVMVTSRANQWPSARRHDQVPAMKERRSAHAPRDTRDPDFAHHRSDPVDPNPQAIDVRAGDDDVATLAMEGWIHELTIPALRGSCEGTY